MTFKALKHEANRICASLHRLPVNEREAVFYIELSKLPPDAQEIVLTFVTTAIAIRDDHSEKKMKTWEKITMIAAGATLIATMLVLAINFPKPTDFQIYIFRVVIAVAASAFTCTLPGFLNIESKSAVLSLRAGGALAVFLLVYKFNPPSLMVETKSNPPPANISNP